MTDFRHETCAYYPQTSFLENGLPRTVRVTKPLHDSIVGRIKKTFSGSSGQISPVKGLKRLCHVEADNKGKKSEGDDKDREASYICGEGDINPNLVSVEELEETGSRLSNQQENTENESEDNNILTNGDLPKVRCEYPAGEATKFLFKNVGRVDSEEETVLDNGAVGSPKIVLTSPKSKTGDGNKPSPIPRAQTFDSGVGDTCRSPCQKKAIEIVQTDDEITVVVKGDVSVRSEDISSTDPNTPRRFIISSARHNNNNNKSNISQSIEHNHNNNTSSSSHGSVSRSSSRKRSGRSSPGRVSPTGRRNSRSPVTSPTRHYNDEDNGRGRNSEIMR